MSALSKAEISQMLCTELELEKKDAKKILEYFFDVIKETLAQGEAVKLSGFGNFEVRGKRARPGRNPRTGEAVTVNARRVVTFKAGLKLKRRVLS
jgi:integration host factor subunit alpha